MKQAIGYIRVSTEKQANEGVSLEAQEAKIVTWCKANGYELVKVYVDAGISGKRMDTRKDLLIADTLLAQTLDHACARALRGHAQAGQAACHGFNHSRTIES